MSENKLKLTNDHWKNWASRLVDGLDCQNFAENQIQDYWYPGEWWEIPNHPCLFNVSGDPYDHSLELDVAYIDTEEKAIEFFDTKITKEFVDFIAENGVKHFWINFYETEEKKTPKRREIHVGFNTKTLTQLESIKDDIPRKTLKTAKIE